MACWSSVVGSGAIVLDNAVVEKNAILGPGALLGPGKRVPEGQYWEGVPAQYVRDVSAEEAAAVRREAQHQLMLARVHAEECAKPWEEVEEDRILAEDTERRADYYFKRLTKEQLEDKEGFVRGKPYPGRIFNSEITPPQQT